MDLAHPLTVGAQVDPPSRAPRKRPDAHAPPRTEAFIKPWACARETGSILTSTGVVTIAAWPWGTKNSYAVQLGVSMLMIASVFEMVAEAMRPPEARSWIDWLSRCSMTPLPASTLAVTPSEMLFVIPGMTRL